MRALLLPRPIRARFEHSSRCLFLVTALVLCALPFLATAEEPVPQDDFGEDVVRPRPKKKVTETTPDDEYALPHQRYLESSYLLYGLPWLGPTGYPGLLFEAQVAPHLFLFNNLAQQSSSGTDGFAHAVSFTFQLKLRMVADYSAPVRMPSYSPRLNYQLFIIRRPQPHDVRLWEAHAFLGHHSNGQEHCTFEERLEIEGCAPITGTSDLGYEQRWNGKFSTRLNRRSGQFSTNFITLGGHWERLHTDDNYFADRGLSAGLQLEIHPTGMGPGGISEEQSYLYGPVRVRTDLEATWLQGASRTLGRFTTHLTAQYAFGTHYGVAPYQASLEVSRTFFRAGGLGGFVRLYSGQDYYNASFVDRVNVLAQFGLIWDSAPPLKFDIAPH